VNHPGVSEDDELDRIMRDVGHEMMKEEPKQVKHRNFGLRRQPKREVPFMAQPVRAKPPQPAPAPVHHAEPKPMPAVRVEPKPIPLAKPQANVKAEPKNQPSMPVFVIFVTILVTGFLIAAAIAAYRQ
jgi:hypothetical protein